MSKPFTSAIIAAIISSGLFLFIFGIGLGFIFMFLPSLPLFTLGLNKEKSELPLAIFLAGAIIAVTAGLSGAILFCLFLGLPVLYISRRSSLWRTDVESTQQWFPLGIIFTQLTVCACATVALVGLYYASQPETLPQLLSQNIHEVFTDLQDEYGDVIDMLAGKWSFLIFTVTIWLWGLALYLHGWLAHRALKRKHLQLRPDFALRPFTMPTWMLSLLAICALASLIGGESMRFIGKSSLISLLLPYFMLGASLMNSAAAKWSNGRFILFFLYFLIFAQFWPALILSGMGIWYQVKHLNKHLSGGPTSTKS